MKQKRKRLTWSVVCLRVRAVLPANYHRNSILLSSDQRDLVHRESRALYQSYQAKISGLYARATCVNFAEGYDAWVHSHRIHQSTILAFCLLHQCSPVGIHFF